ncbi:NACHT and WD repeat domain-containing protein 2-like [Haliotis cracherodii]|uniref:NACHT and WD repeat domain-containing protein 2-like n=1 Tax=Haliotis cracherodii TaxID=6455 RepID=UPI0039E7CA04
MADQHDLPEGTPLSEIPDEIQEKKDRVLVGCLDDLPALSSKIVRIFTSSTFTDTTLERNTLMERVYPKLKEYCRERHGLEFQVVDMRWGVRDEATDDHMTTELCMQEIDNCQRLSMGPSFVVFLGQKYGYRPLPTHIPASEFLMLREVAKNVQSELELFDTWYKVDENSVPPVYILQPISSILTNFNNKRHPRLQEQDQSTWWETFSKLQRIIRKAAQVLFITKKIDREQMHNYFMSVTEREIERGILKARDVEEHCLAYVRDISNINTTLLRIAGKFVDFASRNVDGEAQKFLKILRDEKIPKVLSASNIARFVVEWSGKDGIDSETHKDYFEQFIDHFYQNIIRLVDNAMSKHERLAGDVIYTESLQHMHACRMFCTVFRGREEVVERIHQYVVGPSNMPLVLCGESGCGKTSLMAKGASQVKTWFSEDKSPIMILRFLGTTPGSSTIMPLLSSLCNQIAYLLGEPLDEIPEELAPLGHHFKKLLSLTPENKPIVLFLDSLDQLSGSYGAHTLTWLPALLPPHVKIIVSTLPNYYNLLDTLKIIIEDKDNFVPVLPLGENLSSTILKAWLKTINRTVTESQWGIVNEAITKCNLPLFVKLVFDEICRWKSYTSPKLTSLCSSIHESIMKLYEKIENQHGKTLVSHALGYITASKSGLSEAELEDMLSLDDKVLNDVYQYHLPPVRRIPPLLWTRIRGDLPGYLSEREADGVNVIFWYHRQFIDAARERYFKNLNFVSAMHSEMADYFLGTWGGGRPKPYEYSELQRQRFFLDETKGESDRKVPVQPLVFYNKEGQVTRYNLRKLNELPFHLIRSHRYDDLYETVLFNYNWLHAKMSSMPLQSVLADFEDLLEHVYDKDVKLIADAIRLSSSILNHYPSMLGPQITGRLLPYYAHNPKIRSLIEQCDTDGLPNCALVPTFHCLHTPSGPLQYSLEGHAFAPYGVAVTSDAKYLVTASNKIIIWDLSTGVVFRNIAVGISGIMSSISISTNDKYAVSHTNNNQVVVCSIKTGEFFVITPVTTDNTQTVDGTTVSNTHIAIWIQRHWHLYTIEGKLVGRFESELKMRLLKVIFANDDKNYLILKSGTEDDHDMALEVQDRSIDPFEFHSAIAITADKQILYTCIEISDNAVAVYKREESVWKYDRTLGENSDQVFALTLTEEENYLIATSALGYKLWDLKTDKVRELKLPAGTRNIPTKNQLTSMVVFTKGNQFVVAGVRKNLYVWDVKQGNMVKTLDAHFGRIIALTAVHVGCNVVISSSMDKTIKVWNFDKILEEVHPVNRLEKPIETIHLCPKVGMCVTTTRNLVAVWSTETGRLVKEFSSNSRSAIVTHAVCTEDGAYIISAESGSLVFWDVEKEKAFKTVQLGDVQMVQLNEEDTRVIAVAKSAGGKGVCSCFSLPEAEEVYKFEYNVKKYRQPVLTKDGLFLAVPASDKSGDVVGAYHAKTGTHLYNLQLKYNNYIEYSHLVAMPHDQNQIAVIDPDKGNILDLKKKTLVRSVNRWNGCATQNGKIGLYAPLRGGLQLIEVRTGKTVKTMIPKVAEGVFSIKVMFTKNDKHVIYYHSGRRTIRVFRVSDCKMVANFKASADVRCMVGDDTGSSLVISTVDGSLTVLTLADPGEESSQELIKSLPSRQLHKAANGRGAANGDVFQAKTTIGTALQVARFVAKARGAQKSRACVIS